MGRTIPSFRIAEAQEAAEWRAFRKALQAQDRVAFDDMLNSARLYASASSAAVRPSRFEGMAMAIIFHHQKMLAKLAGTISELQRERVGLALSDARDKNNANSSKTASPKVK